MADVVAISTRRRLPCPHCDTTMPAAHLDGHLRFECGVLRSKRRHPSNGGGAA